MTEFPDKVRVVLASTCLAACAPAISSSNGPDPRAVQPERPSVATHAGTVAPGYLEIESGVEGDRNPDKTHALSIPTVFKFGAAPRVQLSVFAPALNQPGISLGMGDVGVGVKWRLIEGSDLFQRFAIQPSVKWPTGGDRGTHTTDFSLLLIDSRSIGPVSLDLNAGLTRRSGDGNDVPRTATLWTASSAIPIGGSFGWQLECFGYPGTHGPSGSVPIVAILTGPTLAAWRSVAFDAGVILPLAGPQPRAVYAGVVANVGRFLPRP